MNRPPVKTVRECLDIQRASREPDIEIALQDFFDLTPDEQKEFLLVSILELYKQIAWCIYTIENRK